jgi:hypothetical protein
VYLYEANLQKPLDLILSVMRDVSKQRVSAGLFLTERLPVIIGFPEAAPAKGAYKNESDR